MEKVLYVATYGDFFASFQIDNMKLWQKLGCEVHCAADFTDKNYNRFTEKIDAIGVTKHQVDFVRTPFSLKNFNAYKQIKNILNDEEITILDTHNPVASILSRLAAKSAGIKKVMYTVHGFFFYKGASLKNNLLFKPVEFVMARLTDIIITTNLEDYEAAKKMKVRGKSYYVHGVGVDVSNIRKLLISKAEKRNEFGIPEDALVMISIGENIPRKNHETAIRAFAKLNNQNVYYIVVGDGALHQYLIDLSKELGVKDRVLFPGYREDANELLKMSDIYVFPSLQEGLSVALMQAMAAKLPVIASKIRGNVDCIDNELGGITVAAKDIGGFTKAMEKMIESPEMRRKFGEYNSIKVESFGKDVVKAENNEIFKSILSNQ